jgi:hypothetical protein
MSLGAALALARQGFAVFPVVGKRPITPKGVYSASTDPRVFCCFDWGRGTDCAIATGAASGIGVLDVDVRNSQTLEGQERSSPLHGCEGVNGFATLAALGAELPETLAASTPNAGRHYYFKHVEGSRNRTLGQGLEWFTTGKLVVVPPAQGRAWLNDAQIAEAPDWLKQLVLAPINHGCRENFSGPLVVASIGEADARVPKPVYLEILRKATPREQRRARALYNLLAAKRRGRNNALNYVAYCFRELPIAREGAAQLLMMASQANGYLAKDGEEACRLTIMSGLGLKEWPTQGLAMGES